MKTQILIQIDDNNEPAIETMENAEGKRALFITAENLEQAKELLSKVKEPGRKKAKETKKGQNFIFYLKSVEKMETEAKEFEQSKEGKALLKRLNEACQLSFEHHDTITTKELLYLANKHKNSLIDGSFDIAILAYMDGYNEAKNILLQALSGV